ncbi:MAG: hypothetical protein ACLQO7_03410 [Candidatus Bathyarchaeia archaeon]
MLSILLRKEISSLRGKACKRIIKAASLNDTWNMKRYSAINIYLADLDDRTVSIRRYARSIDLTAVKTCSKALSTRSSRHGKSPCFSRCGILKIVSVDYPLLVLASVDVEEFLECAF